MIKKILSGLALVAGLACLGTMFMGDAEAAPVVATVVSGDTIKPWVGDAPSIERVDTDAVFDNLILNLDIIMSYSVCEGASNCISDAYDALYDAYDKYADSEQDAWDNAVASVSTLNALYASGIIDEATYTGIFNTFSSVYDAATTDALTSYIDASAAAFEAFCDCLEQFTECKCATESI